MKLSYAMQGLSAALDAAERDAKKAALAGIGRAGDNLKAALREQVQAAGFPDRLAKTWANKTYPNDGKNPAALVYSKAPKIIDSYARGATLVATNGRRTMAIPTENTPNGRGGKALTPAQVESKFGRKLRFEPAKGAGHAGSTIGYLVLDGVVASKTKSRFRNAGPRSSARAQSVLMFTLVRQVRKPKLFDLPATADAIASTVPQLIAEEWPA